MQLYRACHLPGWREPLIPVKVHKVLGHKIWPKSEGCITIPFRKYSKVVEIVKSSSKPLMLWVYE